MDPIDGWHHVMNRGVDRKAIFFCDDDRQEFGRCLAVACRRYGIELHAYCLMNNHFHLLLRCPDGGLSPMMQLACGLFAASVNRRNDRVGHLFGSRFTSRLITTSQYVAVAVRYIHRNPLAIDGIERCGDYRWSSHQIYMGERAAADWMRTDHVLRWFENRNAFDSFVNGSATPSRPGWIAARSAESVAAGDLLSTVDLLIAERSTLRGRAVLAQRRAVTLDLTDSPNADVRAALDLTTTSAVSSARHRSRRHLADTAESREIVTSLRELLGLEQPWPDTARHVS